MRSALCAAPIPVEAMAESLQQFDLADLEHKRERENAEAETHRHRRDELNDKTREWVEKRDALNAQVRALVDTATGHRARRDELNAEVKKAKEERDRWNRRVAELMDRLTELKRTRMPRGGSQLARLRRDLRALEFRQMTSVLSVDKERTLIEELQKLQAEVRRLEKALEEDEAVRAAIAELREAKENAETAHRRVSELADEAQREHDAMTQVYEQSDELRRQADLAQEEFIRTKMLADEEHRKHIERIRSVHDYDKIIQGIRMKARKDRESTEDLSAKQQAEMIFDRFKRGEKLSTEDLLTLQKSGYL